MADEDITLDGKPLQSLRVADLKAALEQRNLPKSGQKNTLIKRLKGVSFLQCYGRLSSLAKFSSGRETVGVNSRGRPQRCQSSEAGIHKSAGTLLAFKNIVIRRSANVNRTTVSIVRVGTRFLASLSAPCCSQLNCAPVKSRPKLSVSGASRAAAHSVQYTTVPALGLFGGWGGCAPRDVNTVVTSLS